MSAQAAQLRELLSGANLAGPAGSAAPSGGGADPATAALLQAMFGGGGDGGGAMSAGPMGMGAGLAMPGTPGLASPGLALPALPAVPDLSLEAAPSAGSASSGAGKGSATWAPLGESRVASASAAVAQAVLQRKRLATLAAAASAGWSASPRQAGGGIGTATPTATAAGSALDRIKAKVSSRAGVDGGDGALRATTPLDALVTGATYTVNLVSSASTDPAGAPADAARVPPTAPAAATAPGTSGGDDPSAAGARLRSVLALPRLPPVDELQTEYKLAVAFGRRTFTYLDPVSLAIRLDTVLQGATDTGFVVGGMLGLVADPDLMWSMAAHRRAHGTVLPWRSEYWQTLEGDPLGGEDDSDTTAEGDVVGGGRGAAHGAHDDFGGGVGALDMDLDDYDVGLSRSGDGDITGGDSARAVAGVDASGAGSDNDDGLATATAMPAAEAAAGGAAAAGAGAAAAAAGTPAPASPPVSTAAAAVQPKPKVKARAPPRWFAALRDSLDTAFDNLTATEDGIGPEAVDCMFHCSRFGCAAAPSGGAPAASTVAIKCPFRHRAERMAAISKLASTRGACSAMPGWGVELFGVGS